MSAEHPDPDDAALAIGPSRPLRLDPGSETHCQTDPSTESAPREPPLSVRIERTRLRLRIAALECALETSTRHRQCVIDHYERLLTEQRTTDDAAPRDSRPWSPVQRVLEALS